MRLILSAVTAAVLVGGCVALVYGIALREARVVQPIAFNHAVHLSGADMQCIECHTGAESGRYAGLPRKAVCLDCHDIDEEEGSHPEKTKLFAFDESDEEIPWRRVAVSAPHVFFSHRRHVSAAGLDCLVCHSEQPALTAPPSVARLVMTMTDCIDCHEKNQVSSDCLACHR